MKYKKYPKRDAIKNYFPLPKKIFLLGLKPGELAVYAYLLYCEDRETYQCWPSYRTIGRAVERGLIVTEPTSIRTKDGRKRNGSLLYTIRPIQEALDRFYEWQMAQASTQYTHIIPRNPTEGTTVPRQCNGSKRVLNDRDLDAFFAVIEDDDIWHDFFYTEITTGLRRGEICGLKWSDLDEATGRLKVQRSVSDNSEIGETKTETGTRTILLPPNILHILKKRHRRRNLSRTRAKYGEAAQAGCIK